MSFANPDESLGSLIAGQSPLYNNVNSCRVIATDHDFGDFFKVDFFASTQEDVHITMWWHIVRWKANTHKHCTNCTHDKDDWKVQIKKVEVHFPWQIKHIFYNLSYKTCLRLSVVISLGTSLQWSLTIYHDCTLVYPSTLCGNDMPKLVYQCALFYLHKFVSLESITPLSSKTYNAGLRSVQSTAARSS